ncbi:MAG TPA: phosphomannose isomerase type II C-terminal cupin domain [Candidatus Omnitrophota bacterium]|nr:phosphomannose isomerase type II C-terminal cupin domain [Candidatus Omnitrophota bacterium]
MEKNKENNLINYFERPWGFYFKFFEEKGVWVKRIEVAAGGRLSLQKHQYRSEKWNIVSGLGLVILGDKEVSVKAGSVVDIPVGLSIVSQIQENQNWFLLRSLVESIYQKTILFV